MAAGLPAVGHPPVHLLGPGGPGAGRRRPAHPAGKRDYAMLLLLVTYGLRAREVAALTLDDIDWKRERLAVPGRKAGHSTAFPLAVSVGAALADYLQHGRPPAAGRRVFFRAAAPVRPVGAAAVSAAARRYLLKAGIDVPRPGSHTLRHTAVQQLVDAGFPLKTIGDSSATARPAPPRSTPRWPSSRCGRSPWATASRCWHDRHPRIRRRRVPGPQAGDRAQVPQRGSRAPAAGPLRQRAQRGPPRPAHARPGR